MNLSLVYKAFCGWEVDGLVNRFKHADIMWTEVNAHWGSKAVAHIKLL